MCGRFVQTPIRDAYARLFPQLVGDLLSMPASYNLAPTQRASVILDRGTGLQLTRLSWGLLPFWDKAKNLQGSTMPGSRPSQRNRRSARRSRSGGA